MPKDKSMIVDRLFSRLALILSPILLPLFQYTGAAQGIDQSFTNAPYSSAAVTSLTGDTVFAQSFTVGTAGLLTGVDLLVFDGTSWFGANSPPVSDMTVQIRTVTGGVPSATILASSIVPASNLVPHPNGQFTHVNFPTGITVAPGQVLALTIAGVGVGCYLQTGSTATYPAGQAFTKTHAGSPWTPYPDPGGGSADFLFQTYVKAAKPSAKIISSQLTNGFVLVRFAGTSNHAFTIDRAANSAGPWQMGYTNLTSDSNGNFQLFDPVSPAAAAGFYRVR